MPCSELGAKIEAGDARLDGKIERLQEAINSAKVWALLLYGALAAGLYATLARLRLDLGALRSVSH